MEHHPADPLCKSGRVEGVFGDGVRDGWSQGRDGDATVEDVWLSLSLYPDSCLGLLSGCLFFLSHL